MNDRAKAARGARSAAAATTLLQAAHDRLPVGFALFGADLELAAWNPRFAALGGYPRTLVKVGTPLESFVRFDVVRGGNRERATESLARQRLATLKRGRRTDREETLPDGRIIRIASESVPPGGVLLTYEDVTESRRNEERLRESGARYELALRGISEGFYDWDIANGTIHYSDRVRSVLGMSPVELRTPGHWRARIHPDDLKRYDAAHVAHFKGDTERFECDYRYRGRDGAWRWARQHGVALRDGQGRAYRMVGSTGDITALKRAEDALRASEERYALATAAATEGIYEWNVETGALFLSDRAKTFFAFPADRLGPEDWNARVHPEDLEAYRQATRDHFKGRTPHLELEYRIRDAAAGYRWVLDRGVGVRNSAGQVTKLVGALTDVTQRKRAELELRRARDEATAALGEQTALREVLEAISRSAFDLGAVLRTLIEHATRLVGAEKGFIFRLEGDAYRLAVDFGATPEFRAFIERNPIRAHSGGLVGLTAREGRTVHIEDAVTDPRYQWHESQRLGGFRTMLGVPLLRDGSVIGVIALWKDQVAPFTQAQIDLVTAFSNQALIAIENVRLFNETREALEQQTATAEILRVISSSSTDVQPVFEEIMRAAARLCDSSLAAIFRFDGKLLHLAASHNWTVDARTHVAGQYPMPPSSDRISGRIVLSRQVVRIDDTLADPGYDQATARAGGWRRMLGVPMLREGAPIGAIVVAWREPGTTPERQVELLQTFADQAVIAIENVRLFNETKEALEQQTATAEILRVIASSPADEQPVFDAIVAHAGRVAGDCSVNVSRLVGDKLHLAAYTRISPEADEALKRVYPVSATEVARPLARALREKAPFHVGDFETDPDVSHKARDVMRTRGFRSTLYVPIVRGEVVYGVMHVSKVEPGPFPDHWINMLRIFANQAVIAIENVRLFNETKEALEQQRASAEVLTVISNSMADARPVFDKIVESCERLFASSRVGLNLIGPDGLVHAGAYGNFPGAEKLRKENFPHPVAGSATGAAITAGRVVNYPDVFGDPDIPPYARRGAETVGFRSFLMAPLLSEGRGLGAIFVGRETVGAFTEKEIALLKTFADQAVIAIQNARLFNETKEALDQQKASAEVLQVISSSVADTTPVFDKILESCQRLLESANVGIALVGEDGVVHLAAYEGSNREQVERHYPLPLTGESGAGEAILKRDVAHYPDVDAANVPEYARRGASVAGFKSLAVAPMLWEGRGIGTIFVGREHRGAFSEKEIALLKTFAHQAVIAIQNARLFHEIQEKSHQLEIADQHKSAFLANMSHELRTPLNAVIGFSEMLNARYFGDLTAKQAEYVTDIHASGKHLLSLINDILDLSKIEAGRMELELGEFDLPAALDNALTLVRERAQRGGVALRLETDSGLREFRGDERKLKQVMLNLLSNAVKFTPAGGAVSVAAKQVDGNAEIAVSDTGVGIAPEDQEAIFEAFRQVGTDVTRKREGTGLGLALARRFVELHGGTIRVASAPGKGSTFTVRLPIRHGE